MGRAYSPSRKPFLKRRGRCLRYLMRPVPVVRRPIAFTDQLSERKRGKGGRVSVRSGIVGGVVANPRPLRSVSRWEEGSGGVLTVALAGGGVTARAAGGLLDVVSTTSTPVGASRMRWSVEFRDGTEVAALKKRGAVNEMKWAGSLRTACRECATCYDAYRTSRYPFRSYPCWYVNDVGYQRRVCAL